MTYLFDSNTRIINEVEIKNDSANSLPISKNTIENSNENPIFVKGTSDTSFFSDSQSDAFGRLRVSEEISIGDYKHTYGTSQDFIDHVIGGGSISHVQNHSCVRLQTSSNTSSYAMHQTKMYHKYIPGKSQFIKTTINFYSNTTNVIKRTGYFDDYNGIYLEQDGNGVLSFVIRTNTSGSVSDSRKVIQSEWNIDTCNTNIACSDITSSSYGKFGTWDLNISKTQIFFIDFQWLGVGRVRCGFVHNGQIIIAHEFYNSNNLDVVYMSNPNLPIRCEIFNVGSTSGAYLDQICSSVSSEGGYDESDFDYAVDSGKTAKTVLVGNGLVPIVAIRLKNSFNGYPNRVVIRSGNINVYAENFPAYWKLIKLSNVSKISLANSTWISVNSNSAVEYNLSGISIGSGDVVDGGIVGTSSPGGSAKGTGTSPINNASKSKKNYIVQNRDSSNSEIYVVCANAINGNCDVWVDFQWKEIY